MPALSDAPLLYLVEHAEPDWVAMNERNLSVDHSCSQVPGYPASGSFQGGVDDLGHGGVGGVVTAEFGVGQA
jgi:hypothetical protein